jgi:hypothetical protein
MDDAINTFIRWQVVHSWVNSCGYVQHPDKVFHHVVQVLGHLCIGGETTNGVIV